MSKREKDSGVTPNPFYPLPDADRLEVTELNERLRERVEEFHVGLKSMWIECAFKNDRGQTLKDTFQKYAIKNGGATIRPAMPVEDITRVLYLRCKQYAAKQQRKVQFKIWFYGEDDDSSVYKNCTQITIDGTESHEVNDLTTDPPVTPPAATVASPPPPEMSTLSVVEETAMLPDPDAGKERATAEFFNQTKLPSLPAASDVPAWVANAIQHAMQLAAGAGSAMTPQAVALLEQSRLMHGKEIHDVSALARDMIQQFAGASATQNKSIAEAVVLVLGKMTENHQRHLEDNAGLRDKMFEVITILSNEVASANRRAAATEGRVSELIAKIGHDDEAKGAKGIAWGAFEHAMQMLMTATERMGQAQVMEAVSRVEQVQPQALPEPAGPGVVEKIYSDIKPFIALAASEVMRSRGNHAAARSAAKMAESFADGTELEDDEDEDEEVDNAEAAAPAGPAQMPAAVARARTNGTAPRTATPRPAAPPSLHGKLASLHRSLLVDQTKSLSEIMPPAAWTGFCNAAAQTNDQMATMMLIPLGAALKKDPTLEHRVRGVLDNTQTAVLGQIIATLRAQMNPQGPPPPRPTPSRPPSRPPSAAQG